MPFVKRAVLEKLLRDDAEWMRLLRQERVEGAAEAAAPRDRLIANQQKLIEDQAGLIEHLKKPVGVLKQGISVPEKMVKPEPGRVTERLGMGDLRGSGQVISEPGGVLLNEETDLGHDLSRGS